MTPERWRRIDDLLQQTLKRPPDERAAFLDEVCADKAARIEIESLISFGEQADSFLEVPAFEAAAALVCEGQAAEIVGLVIGPYEIQAQLGSGGMGEVYLAHDSKLDRKVAIKFLPAFLEADELAKRRLVKEARAAAKLDHPNICTIYEVVEDASHTFIVMQCVQGETLASRIERAPLKTREAIDVAMKLADALVEAHSNGIIHRDIKPQNIMITSRLQVKVLDFGLAKTVRSPEIALQNQSQLSAPGIVVGTAAYMSPEQARGDSVDERSDLFSLGVVLYECVAHRKPFGGATPMEICAQVIHVDPPPPSRFDRRVAPELDTVIVKALAKDPLARYQSATDMLEALRAVDVLLRTDSTFSEKSLLRRLARSTETMLMSLAGAGWRRRGFVVIAVAVLTLALLAYLWVVPGSRATSYSPSSEALQWYKVGTNALRNGTYYDASIALQRATAADDKFVLAHAVLAEAWMELGYLDRANQELLRARALVGNVSALPRLEQHYLQAITHVVLREFPLAIESYQAITREAPDAERAQAYVDLGRAYEKNSEVEKALESYQRATQLAPSDVAGYLRLGILYSERQQNLTSALEALQKAEDIYQALRNYEGVTEVLFQRGTLYYNQYKPSEARAQLEKAIEITKTTENRYQQIRALSVLGNVSDAQGDVTQAKQQANLAIEIARANAIANQVTSGFIWLGNIFLMSGQYDDAEKAYQEGLDLAQRDRDRLNEAWALRSLGSLRMQQGRTDEALRFLEPARLFFEIGGYRKWLSLTLTLIGRAYRDKGELEAAVAAFRDLIRQGEQANDLFQTAFAHSEIGGVLTIEEQYPAALGEYDESYQIFSSLNSQVSIGYSSMHRGCVLWQLGRYEEARAALDEASSIALRPSGTYKPLLASIYLADSFLELSRRHFRESKLRAQQALDLAGTQDKSTAAQATFALGLIKTRSGAQRAGMPVCEEAVGMAKTTSDPRLVASSSLAFAEALLECGQTQRALDNALQAQQSFERVGQQDSQWRAWLIAALARQLLGDVTGAREFASNAAAGLAELERRWGQQAFGGYRSRLDVQHFQTQLDQILTTSTIKEN